jgi:hypothetical protein
MIELRQRRGTRKKREKKVEKNMPVLHTQVKKLN